MAAVAVDGVATILARFSGATNTGWLVMRKLAGGSVQLRLNTYISYCRISYK